ncbi:hypothetical protein ACWYRQ_17800 [Clostridioides difficile]
METLLKYRYYYAIEKNTKVNTANDSIIAEKPIELICDKNKSTLVLILFID